MISQHNRKRAVGQVSYDEAASSLLQHCQVYSKPVVLIAGYHGAEKTRLIRESAQTDGLVLREAHSEDIPGRLLQRRLQAVDTDQEKTVVQAADLIQLSCRAVPRERGHVLVQNIDLLDDDSLQVLDLLIRRGQTGIFMTASAPSRLGHRYARVLGSSRGLHVSVVPLSEQEIGQRLEQRLEAPPTSGLRDYLHRCSAGVPRTLDRAVEVGQDEGWIGTVGSRSVIMRPPIWMDSQHAMSFRNEVKEVLGGEALRLLEAVAVEEECPLPRLLTMADDGIFVLEEAGLLSIESGKVRLARPVHQHLLLRGVNSGEVEGGATAERTMVARLAGAPVDRLQASCAAEVLMRRGLIEQARFVGAAIPPGDPRGEQIEACASVLTGAPRRALHRLSGKAEASEAGESVLVALNGFLESVLLRLPVPGAAQCDLFGEIVRQLEVFENSDAETYLALIPEIVSQQRWEEYKRVWQERRGEATQAADPDLPLLALATGLAVDAYAAAVADDRARAQAAIDLFTQLPAASIPAVGMDWVCEYIGLASILISAGEELIPSERLAGESPERALLRTTSSETVLLFQSLVRGDPIEVLRHRLDEVWAQFEAGLARGRVTRRLLEAFDFVVEGDRSEELNGPAKMIVPQLGDRFRDPWVDVLLLTGRLLHCPPEELPHHLETGFVGRTDTVGVRRLTIRCVILRRAAELPYDALELLVSMGESSGVESEVLAFASALVGKPKQESVSAALDRLRESCPRFHVMRPGQKPPAAYARSLKTDRLKLLSKREREIAELVIAGTTAMQAANLCGISTRTVQTHVRNVYRKLNVGSRTELRAELLSGLEVRP